MPLVFLSDQLLQGSAPPAARSPTGLVRTLWCSSFGKGFGQPVGNRLEHDGSCSHRARPSKAAARLSAPMPRRHGKQASVVFRGNFQGVSTRSPRRTCVMQLLNAISKLGCHKVRQGNGWAAAWWPRRCQQTRASRFAGAGHTTSMRASVRDLIRVEGDVVLVHAVLRRVRGHHGVGGQPAAVR